MGRRVKKLNIARTQTMLAPCDLSDEEVAERSNQLVRLLVEIDGRRIELKTYAKQERAVIAGKVQEAVTLRDVVVSHKEEREVAVDVSMRGGQVITVRSDTGEVLETRDASDEERQQGMFQ